MPERIQRKRSKGWRMPENAIYVGRPTMWGNPFKFTNIEKCYSDEERRQYAVDDYAEWLNHGFPQAEHCREFDNQREYILEHLHELKGKNLVCWCPTNKPCHADVLLRLANNGVNSD